MGNDTLAYIIFSIILFIGGVFLTRWIFGIEKIISQLRQQTEHLNEMNELSYDQRALLKLMTIEKLGFNKQIVVNAKKDGKIFYPTLEEWIEKYSGAGYTTDVVDK